MSIRWLAARAAAATLTLSACASLALAADADTVSMKYDPARYGIVVSATKTSKAALEIPNATALVKGEGLRRSGARTLADALIDVVGVEIGGGSDNGGRLPNIGMWGLKEFDALLITVDGVPIGGPFNPSLAQIAVDDIDHIEIVKGPQGTLYGMSAFAGMIQVFTNRSATAARSITLGGGSFSTLNGSLGVHQALNPEWNLDLVVSDQGGDGWQDRTHADVARGRLSLSRNAGHAHQSFDIVGFSDRQEWGTPTPVDQGKVLAGFARTHNYAVGGATVDHDVVAVSHRMSIPTSEHCSFENTIGFTRDNQKSIRNFFADFPNPDTVGSAGIAIQPIENDFFDDARLVSHFELGGRHEMVTGAAITWGRTKASGIGFDFDQSLSNPGSIPSWQDIPVGDHRAFEDRRTFLGAYAHDAWTPVSRFTLSGGGRWDHANEKLHAFGQEVGGTAAFADDARTDAAWSGDLAGLIRLLPGGGMGELGVLNVYGNWKSSFKPSAPNLTEAENAHILDPERTHSIEGGLKAVVLDGQLTFDASMFQMDFHNTVVSVLGSGGGPELVNAGHLRFKGVEVGGSLSPNPLHGLTLSGGWAIHDPRFVQFSFFADPADPSSLRIVDGKIIELAPRQLWNGRVSYARKQFGIWGAMRHEGARPLTRRNTFWAEPFDEIDAGVSVETHGALIAVTGRNLDDNVHFVAESEIGDSQFYYAPPKRYTASVTYSF